MKIPRLLLVEFGVSLVIGLGACLGVSAYLAGTSNATRVAAAAETSKDPVVNIIAYSGMGFSLAMVEPESKADSLRDLGIHVHDRKGAGSGMEWSMDALRDRQVTIAGAFGWPALFCRWTYVAAPAATSGPGATAPVADGPVRGVYAWGPSRRFDVELPPPAPGRGGFTPMWPQANPPRVSLANVPSYMLPTSPAHIDFASFAVSASVFIVGCWIVIHMLIELVRLILGLGKAAAE